MYYKRDGKRSLCCQSVRQFDKETLRDFNEYFEEIFSNYRSCSSFWTSKKDFFFLEDSETFKYSFEYIIQEFNQKHLIMYHKPDFFLSDIQIFKQEFFLKEH